MRSWRMLFLSLVLCGAGTSTLVAQHPLIHSDGDEQRQAAMEKPRARAEFEFHRVAWPSGSIPEGARARAFRDTRHMPMFAPGGKGAAMRDYVWKNIGPFNVGGRIFALALNPKRPETMYAGAADGGVWRSYDAGESWTSLSDDFPTQAMGSIVIDPVDTNVVYAGTGDASFGSLSFDGAGMFKSTDAGATWFQVGEGTLPAYANISDMAIDPVNPSVLYAAIPDGVRDAAQLGIWRSRDAGATWQLVFPGRVTDIVINPAQPEILYTVSSKIFEGGQIIANKGLFRTSNGGDDWTKLDIGITDSLMGRTAIGLCATQPSVLYLGVSEVVGTGRTPLLGVFKSTDAGATWTKKDVPFDYMVSQGWFDNIIGVHPTNPDIVYAGGVKLVRSSDGGENWVRVADQLAGGILHVDQHEIEFDPLQPDRVYVGNDGGLYLLTNEGRTLEKRDIGMSITQFIGGDMYPGNDSFAFGGTQDNGTLVSDTQIDFDLTLYGDGGHGFIHPTQPNVMYTTQERLKLWRSEDFGRTWSWANGDLPNESSLFYIAYAMDKSDPLKLYLGTYRMYTSNNGGKNWSRRQDCLFNPCYYITTVSIAPYDSRMILAGAPTQVALSTDGGTSWKVTSSQLPASSCSSYRTFRPGIMYATYSGYGVPKVWRSTDYGYTWTDINGNLPDIPTFDVIELDQAIVIGTELGSFISEDEGATWQRLGTGMPAVAVQRLMYQKETGVLRAITHGRGMYDMQWTELAQAAPVFVSQPDTRTLHMSEPFVYAPVVHAVPRPSFRLVEAPQGASIDPVLGIVRWTASDIAARFTIEATNAAGSEQQSFTLATNDVLMTDWEIVSRSPMNSVVHHMAMGKDRSLWLARDTAWISRSTDGGSNWEHMRLPNTEVSVITVYPIDKDNVFVGTGGPQSLMNTGSGHIWRSSDGGATWQDVLYGIDSRFGNIHFSDAQHGMAVSQGANDSADVFITSDGGATWSRSKRLSAKVPMYNTLSFVGATGWFGSSNFYVPDNASLMRSTDGGQNWEEKSLGAGFNYVSDIVFLDDRNGWSIDEMSRRIKKSTSGGQRWIVTSYPMNGERLVRMHADKASGAVWVLSDEHAWVSRDLGMTWKRTDFVPCGAMTGMVFADSTTGWIVSRNGIVQKLVRDPFVVSTTPTAVPMDVQLGAPWPNPVTEPTGDLVLPVTLTRAGTVRLALYNSAGKEIALMHERQLAAGEHYLTWTMDALANGVYFVTMSALGQTQTRRIVLAR